jgi:hypothetical protein
VQTRALVKGVAEIATKLKTAGLHYKARNSSRTWRMDHGWYPPDIGAIELSKQDEEKRANKSKNPEHAIRKLTRPCQWLRREAISNLTESHAGPKQTTNATPSADTGTRR